MLWCRYWGEVMWRKGCSSMNSKTIEEVFLYRARKNCYDEHRRTSINKEEAFFNKTGTKKYIDKKSWPLTTPDVWMPQHYQPKGNNVPSPFQRGLTELKLIGTCHPASMSVNSQNQAGCCSAKNGSLYVAMYHERTVVRNEGRKEGG